MNGSNEVEGAVKKSRTHGMQLVGRVSVVSQWLCVCGKHGWAGNIALAKAAYRDHIGAHHPEYTPTLEEPVGNATKYFSRLT